MLISVSCLHFGQNKEKFSSTASSCILSRVLLPHIGHGNHLHSFIITSCFTIMANADAAYFLNMSIA